jgi:membrane-bound serine protease (ClpP class)
MSMRKTVVGWFKVLVLFLDEAAALVLLIVVFRFYGIRISLSIIVILALMVGTLAFILHIAVIPSFRKRPVTGPEGMIGAEGKVVEPLTPFGAITVKGEYWRALSVEDTIAVDEKVEIVGLDGLTVNVKRKK